MRWHFASVCGVCAAYASKLLAQTAHTLANCQRRRRIRQQNRAKMSFCKRMLRMRLQIASVCGACGSTLLAHAVAICWRRRRMRQLEQKGILGERVLAQTAHGVAPRQRMRLQIANLDGAYGSNLLPYAAHAVANCQRTRRMRQQNCVKLCVLLVQTAHTVANCKRMRRMWQHFASVVGAYGSNLLAQTAHAVAKTKMASNSPICIKLKILFQPSSPLPIQTS